MYCILFFRFFFKYLMLYTGRLPFWKPASVFAYHVCIVIAYFWRNKHSSSYFTTDLRHNIMPLMQCSSSRRHRAWNSLPAPHAQDKNDFQRS